MGASILGERLIDDPLRTLAYGTDASFYRLIPKLHYFLLPRLGITPLEERIAVHATCSSTRMGLADKFVSLARACAHEVMVPADITCCGFAGDKVFCTPELNASALQGLAEQVAGCSAGYSNSRTCEIGLSLHGGIPYGSIFSLLDRVNRPKTPHDAQSVG